MTVAPWALTIPLAVVLLLLAGLSAVTARGGFARTLTRTGRLGVHSPPAMASDEAFHVANRVAAPATAGAAVLAAVIALLLLVAGPGTGTAIVLGVVGLVGSLALLLLAGVLGDRAARTVPIPAARPAGRSASCGGCGCGTGGCAVLRGTDPAATTGQP